MIETGDDLGSRTSIPAPMNVEVTAASRPRSRPTSSPLAAGGLLVRKLDALFEGRLVRAAADADPIAVVPVGARAARAAASPWSRSTASTPDDLRTAAARAVRARRGGGTVAWALDDTLPMAETRQVQALVEGAVLGGYDAGRWKSEARGARRRALRRLRRAATELRGGRERAPSSSRAGRTSPASSSTRRRTSSTPAGLAERAAALPGLRVEVLDPAAAGLPGARRRRRVERERRRGSIVLRHEPAERAQRPRLALVGKSVTFDAGGYFLKPQSDIVRQKADMAGGAAVLAALGAIAELELPRRRDRRPRRPART